MLAAALAGCFAMKLSFVLGESDFLPDLLNIAADINLENGSITAASLVVRASVPGVGREVFEAMIKETLSHCPVCKALNIKITIGGILLD